MMNPIQQIPEDLLFRATMNKIRAGHFRFESFPVWQGKKEPPRILEQGRNVYAPKVVVLIEKRSFGCLAPILYEAMLKVFKDYECGQVYYSLFKQGDSLGEAVEDAKILGARLCLFDYDHMDQVWRLYDNSVGCRIYTLPLHHVEYDKRFARDLWYGTRKTALEEPKPKPKGPLTCECGLCDYCLGL